MTSGIALEASYIILVCYCQYSLKKLWFSRYGKSLGKITERIYIAQELAKKEEDLKLSIEHKTRHFLKTQVSY